MKWPARKNVRLSEMSPYSEGEWHRWFAWYPVSMATARDSAHWVWLEFVERKWRTSKYGSGRKRLRYRLPVNSEPDVQQRLHNLTELARKLDVALRRADNKPSGALRCADRLQRNVVLGLLSQPAPWEQRIGVVTHYYSHLSVATMRLELGTTLHVGDVIHIRGHTTDFTQKVESLEVDHAPVTEVGPNDDFGLKVIDHAREHDAVFRVRS
jgi:hypothetical protein